MLTVSSRLDVDDLLAVANTRHGPGGHLGLRCRPGDPMHDHLADALGGRRFLADHDVPVPAGPPPPAALEALRLIRRYLRVGAGDLALLEEAPEADLPTDEAAVRGLFAGYPVRLGPDGTLEAVDASPTWAAFVAELLPPLVSVGRDRARLRLCGNPLCRFLFLDRSRNASRVWCDATVCGNRVRGHRHRIRRASSLGPAGPCGNRSRPPPVGAP